MDRAERKNEHIKYALQMKEPSQSGFDDIRFVHQSVPNMDVQDVDIRTTIGELQLSSPIFINAMTGGGGKRTENINRMLAEIASITNIPMAVGSQMAAIKDETERRSFEIVRRVNEKGIILANIGSEATVDQAQYVIDMLHADALQIHLNVIQELVMPEGDRHFSGAINRIEQILSKVHIPIIVKEVGFGMSKEAARKLANIGVRIIDVGGKGGTNFSAIENYRRKNPLHYFDDWGIITNASIVEVKETAPYLSVIASGGITSSLHVLKSIALGANACGIAGHFLEILMKDGVDCVIQSINEMHDDLKRMMTALGAKTIRDVQNAPIVIHGETYHWLSERGFDTKKYAQRNAFD